MPTTAERARAPEFFVSGLERVDHIGGGNFRFTFYVIDDGEVRQRVAIIMHNEAIPSALVKTGVECGIQIAACLPGGKIEYH